MDHYQCEYCGTSYHQARDQCERCAGSVKASGSGGGKRSHTLAYVVGVVAVLATSVFFLARENSYLWSGKGAPESVRAISAALGSASSGFGTDKQQEYVKAARLSNALAQVSPFRMMLSEYRQQDGGYPESFAELGIDSKTMDTGPDIESLELLEEGVMKVSLVEADFGKNKYFTVTPLSYMDGNAIRWECKTNVGISISRPGKPVCETIP